MNKLLNKKGFTLMEMMIVIAIIVILVAISIPAFSGALDKANVATDAANLRAAKAAVIAYELDGSDANGKVYDVVSGEIITKPATPVVSGKCSDHDDCWIQVIAGEAVWTNDGTNPVAACN